MASRPFGLSGAAGERDDRVEAELAREPHRVAEVGVGTGRHIRVGMQNPDRFSFGVQHVRGDLRHDGIGALSHVDGARRDDDAAVCIDVDQGHRGRGRDDGLYAERQASTSTQNIIAPIE